MKTKFKENKKIEEKSFDTVKIFRNIKDKISKELFGKSNEQIKAYLKKIV